MARAAATNKPATAIFRLALLTRRFSLRLKLPKLNDLIDARLMPSPGYWSNFRRPSYLFEIERLLAGKKYTPRSFLGCK
jgi:hypothetical protein